MTLAEPSRVGQPDVQGAVDGLFAGEVRGWAMRPGLDERVRVGLFLGQRIMAATVADRPRPDLRAAGLGDGAAGFAFPLTDRMTTLAARDGLEAEVRLLDGSGRRLGACVIAARALGPFDPADPRLPSLLSLLEEEVELLLDRLPESGSSLLSSVARPALTAHDALFIPADSSGAPRPSGDETVLLPAFLEYTRLRSHLDRSFDTAMTSDRDHFLAWYLGDYATARGGPRLPLTGALIDYLNAPLTMGGTVPTLTRFTWWRLLRSPEILARYDPSSTDSHLDLLYWWASREAPAIHAEDCLVVPRDIDLLRAVPEAWRQRDFPFNPFLDRMFVEAPEATLLNSSRADDRRLFALAVMLRAVGRPHLLRYLPPGALDLLLAPSTEDGPSPMRAMLEGLGGGDPRLSRLTRAGYAAALRLAGLDIEGMRFLARTAAGHRLEAAALPAPPAADVDVQVIGPFAKASGLGQATRLVATTLDASGLVVRRVGFDLDNPTPETDRRATLAEAVRPRVNLINLNAEALPLAFAYGPDAFSGAYNIGYFFWELGRPAACHRLALNLVDEVWAASEWGAAIYRGATDKPVTVVGLACEPPTAINRHEARAKVLARIGAPDHTFVFLTSFDSYSFVARKNPLGAIRAFQSAFSWRGDVRLIVKTQNRDRIQSPEQLRIWSRIDLLIAADPRIHLVNETMGHDAVMELKAGCDAYLSLHRSEGWGFGMIEAMALGLPVVATGYSGNMEFCSPATAFLVDHKVVPVDMGDYLFAEAGQVWAEPDIDSAARAMVAVVDEPDLRQARVSAALAEVRSRWSVESVATRYRARLAEILAARPA